MKIVFLADALDTQKAGIHFYCKGLLQALDKIETNHELFVVRPKAKKEFRNIAEIEVPIKKGIPIHQRWRQFTSIPKIVSKLNPEIVMELAHFGPFNLKTNIKRVTFIHDISPVLYPQWHTKQSVIAHNLLLEDILKKAVLILTSTNFTKNEIVKKYPIAKGKVEITHLGCTFSQKQLVDEKLLEQTVNEVPYFLYVGTLEPRKNIITLIKAFELFKSKHPNKNINLVLAGGWGWKYNSIEKAIEQSYCKKSIICKGYISEAEKFNLIKNAIAFIYPSLYEGFGIPVVEAMRLGCSVICSNIGSSKEVAGENALYFETQNVNELCQQMIKTINNSPTYEQKKHLVAYSQQFTWQKTAKKTLHIIEQL